MTDYISRADAIEAVEQEYKIDRGYMADDYTYGFNQAIQYVSDIILQELPSAELPKGDLISRADVLKYPIRLDHYDEVNGSREFVYGVESVIEYVESLPSADAVDVNDVTIHYKPYPSADAVPSVSAERVGEWTARKTSLEFVCSNCGEACWRDFNYCPNCGARMTPYKGGDD